MSYATSTDLVTRFGEPQLLLLADRDGDAVIDAAVVESAIGDASAIVDLHVRGRYAVPLTPVPAEIVVIVCDLTRRLLYSNATEIPDSVLAADKAAREQLRLIADGKVVLAVAPALPTDPGASQLELQVSGPERQYTADKLAGY